MPRLAPSLSVLASSILLSLVACSGGTIPVGATAAQKLQTRADGTPTGDGTTCSFEAKSSPSASPAGLAVHNVGDTFKSLDACNDCTCTTAGITCTELACADGSAPLDGGSPVACSDEAKQCPDGTYVGRTGPNCAFAACPSSLQKCGLDAGACPTGEDCYFLQGQGAVCTSDPCSVCPDPSKCTILDTFPAQVACNN